MNNNYSRRKFMKTVVVSAGAVGAGGLAGCGSDSSSSSEDSVGTVVQPTLAFDSSVFPQSVASGDPRQSSIILWTRVSNGLADQTVTVQVATDDAFANVIAQSDLTATSEADFCVKVKITDLNSYTRYYYRFITGGYPSNTGRFRTAPTSTANEDVKFAFVSCQDYTNGYYNTLLKLLEEGNDDVDFVVHLGDYIYETTGDETFQGSVAGRTVSFDDTDGAIDITPGNNLDSSLAASTVDQYRDIYKTYRGDEILQQVHEKFPFVVIWDDHEYSDDCWQETATFFDDLDDSETNEARRRNAEQAFFEFQPIDITPESGNLLAEGQISADRDDLFPSAIYRSLRYGSKLNLVMTDFRTYRPDHIIPEGGFPGTVVVNHLQTAQTLYSLPNATGAAFRAGVDGTLGTSVADILNPTALEQGVLGGVLTNLVTTGALPLLPYVDLASVTDTTLLDFITALNSTLTQLGQPALPVNTLQGLLIYALTAAYQSTDLFDVPLSASAAATQAASVATGEIDVTSLNAILTSFYDGLLETINTLASLETFLTLALGGDAAAAAAAAATVGLLSEGYTNGELTTALTAVFTPSLGAGAAAVQAATVAGQLGLPYATVDAMFARLALILPVPQPNLDNGTAGTVRTLPASVADGLDADFGFEGYCISHALLGKQTLDGNNGVGSRYLVVKSTYDLFCAYKTFIQGDTAYDDAWGLAQTSGVTISLATSSATWNVLGSSTSFTSMVLDNGFDGATPSSMRTAISTLTNLAAGANVSDPADPDDPFNPLPATQFYMNVDQWDGFPIRRTVLMDNTQDDDGNNLLPTSLKASNAVVIAGDIHARFATDHGTDADGGRCVEFVTPAVSSGTIGSFMCTAFAGVAAGDGSIDSDIVSSASAIVGGVPGVWGGLDQALGDANSQIASTDTSVNGLSIIELKTVDGSEAMDVTFHEVETGVIQGALTRVPGVNAATYANYTTNLVTNQYDTASNLTWSTTTYRVTKDANGNNSSPTVVV